MTNHKQRPEGRDHAQAAAGFASSRRDVLLAGTCGALTMAFDRQTLAQDVARSASKEPPYPLVADIRLVRLDEKWLWRHGRGSDQWPHIELDEDRLLAAWGDGWGWSTGGAEPKARMGVTQITGAVEEPVGKDLWRDKVMAMKPCALGQLDDDVILFATSDKDGRDGTSVLLGGSDGKSWSKLPAAVLKKSLHGLQVVGTAGRRPGGDPTQLVVYLAADGNLKTDELYANQRNQTIWAAFLGRGMVSSINGWRFFAGEATVRKNGLRVTLAETGERLGDLSNIVWESVTAGAGGATTAVDEAVFRLAAATTLALPNSSSGGLEAKPVFTDPAGSGKHFLVSWCPSTDSYVAAKTHERNSLGLFSSPTPWGPWKTLFYGPFVEGGAIFTAKVVSMWSKDGIVAVMWSGSPDRSPSENLDAVYLTRFRIA